MKRLSLFSRIYLVLAVIIVGGSVYLWHSGTELGTEARDHAEASAPDNAPPGGTHMMRHRYGFGAYGYHGGK